MAKINVALVGFGTIGGGVADILIKMRNQWLDRFGIDINLKTIVDKDTTSDRGVDVKDVKLTDNYKDAVNDKDIDIIIELVGGYGFAKDLILEAIENGKHIVTANKALVAVHGDEIFAKAKEKGVDVYYEAAVGGGIPIIKAIKESLQANEIDEIFGIINGTCNYILTEMEEKGIEFDVALKDAQDKGFAETDPTFDIDGIDTAHKLAILASLGYWSNFKIDQFNISGIRNISSIDINFAKEMGYSIKLLAIARKREDNSVELRVHPAMIPSKSTLAVISGEFNAVMVRGDNVDELLFKGKGAGRYPTASAVVSDIIDIARNINSNSIARVPNYHDKNSVSVVPFKDIETEYYLRFSTKDKPGVLAVITKILGDNGVSIKSIIQKESDSDCVPLVILTHKTKEGIIQSVINEIQKLDFISDKVQIIRVEEI